MRNKKASDTPYPVESATKKINYAAPTDEDISTGEQIKDSTFSGGEKSVDGSEYSKKKVDVVISNASVYNSIVEIQAFIPENLENGICIFRIYKGQETLTKEVVAYADVSSTICTNPNINKDELSEGSWSFEVSYESTKAEGKSTTGNIIIN